MHGKCKLCNREAKLRVSHFIPKFVGKWIKQTSITGFLRSGHNVDKRSQDLFKEYWLCSDCENLFSAWETQFARKVFYPFVNNETHTVSYESWMPKFCASLSWRTLTYIRSKNSYENKPADYCESLNDAEQHLADYLLNKTYNLNQYEQHIVPLEIIENTTHDDLPTNINRYFLRYVEMNIIENEKDIFIYTKLPCFMIFGVIKLSESNKMRASRVALKYGKIRPSNYCLPSGFKKFITEQAIKISEINRQIPKDQQKRLNQYLYDNPEKAMNSKTFEAFIADYQMFGSDVFK